MPMVRPDGREVPIHRLRPNDKVWTPASVIVLDTEADSVSDAAGDRLTMRLWVACHVDRREVRRKQGPATWGWGAHPDSLAGWIDSRFRGRDNIWLYAHNLNFDLAVTDLIGTMTAQGWTLGDFSVTAGAPWLRLGRGRRTLTVVDSWSWLPTAVESLATLVGRTKVPLPPPEGTDEQWWERCASDVEITARSLFALMDWWDREKLGRWTISGAGCGWNAMRHIDAGERHVIDVEPALVAQDRQAVRGGRKDSTVVRSEHGGPWVEMDLRAAYPTVARELPLPVSRGWTFDSLPLDSRWLRSRQYGVVAVAHIRCDRPRYPVKIGGVNWYPTGEFRTVLAGPELRWAAENGDLVAIGAGQAHKLGWALKPWATWVLDPSRGGTCDVPAVAQVAAKAWGRAVLGKFAARGHSTEMLEGVVPAGWNIEEMWDRRVGRPGAHVTIGGQAYSCTFDLDTENCYPAVLAWIESEVRVRLGRVLEALDGAWWTTDTDGLMVDMGRVTQWAKWGIVTLGNQPRDPIGLGEALGLALRPLTSPLELRPKAMYDSLAVLGPQHLVAGPERRYSGVAKAAVEAAPGEFRSRDWPSLKWQMGHSPPGTYTRPERKMTFRAPTVHRWVLADGSAVPVEARITASGENSLVPWLETATAASGAVLAEAQYRMLDRIR